MNITVQQCSVYCPNTGDGKVYVSLIYINDLPRYIWITDPWMTRTEKGNGHCELLAWGYSVLIIYLPIPQQLCLIKKTNFLNL